MKNTKILIIIAIILLLGTFLDVPYFYFQILRFYICILSGYLAYNYYKNQKQNYFVWIFGIIAILFNPIAPIYFEKELWQIVDLGVIGFFIYSFKK